MKTCDLAHRLVVTLALWLSPIACEMVHGQQDDDSISAQEDTSAPQQAAPPQQDSTVQADTLPQATLPLPLTDRSGRPFRPIGIYQSQLVELVPPTFRAISIGQLQQAVGDDSDRFSKNSDARLVSGFYDIRLDDQLLVSEHSELVIAHDPQRAVRQQLGRVNLAILDSMGAARSMTSSEPDALPRLEVDYEGELIAVIPVAARMSETIGDPIATDSDTKADDSEGDLATVEWTQSKLRFGWTLQSQWLGNTKKFELRLPRTSLTRLVISTPSDVVLESRQGVLVERPGPPPDADVQSRTGDIRWYVLEAGGLDRIELFAKRRSQTESNQPFFVRSESKQYDVNLSGVTWKHRMTIEYPGRRRKIRLRSPLGTVTSVRVNAVETDYQVMRRTDGQSLIDVVLPGGFYGDINTTDRSPSGVESVTLTVEGRSDWDLVDGICELPSANPVGSNVFWTEASTQTVVSISDPLEVAQWILPPEWTQKVQTPSRAGESLLAAEGPPYDNTQTDPVWSRLRLVQRKTRSVEAVWTRLRVQQSPSKLIRSATRILCQLLQVDQSPFRMDLNPDWTVDSVKVVGSGRQISVAPGSRDLAIWPTPDEAAESEMEIEVAAHQNLLGRGKRLEIPSTWVVRPSQHATSNLISIQPPKLRRWDGNSVMLPGRIDPSKLDDDALAFLQPTAETLVLQSLSGLSPAVALEPLDVSFAVSLRHAIETEGSDVTETIVVRAETSQPISEISLLTGQTQHARFDWSLRRIDQSATVSLPNTSVATMPDDPLGTYVIQLDGRDLREYELVGRRFFAADRQLTLSLPSVRDAVNQSAEVYLDDNWELTRVPPGVQLVPGNDPQRSTTLAGEQSQHLRYDPAMRPEIVLRRSRRDAMTCLIWDQLLEFTANSHSEDLVQLVADVSTRKPIQVTFDDELEIVSVALNGSEYTPERIGIGEFSISPEKQSDHVAILFRRRHNTARWIRHCEIPDVSIDGHVVRNRVVFHAGQGTLILHKVVSSPKQPDRTDRKPALASDLGKVTELVLMPRNVAIGMGWLGSAIVFCLAWSLAKWFAMGVHSLFVLVVLAVSASVIWWPWQVAILGWIAVPIAVGGLLQVVIQRSTTSKTFLSHRADSPRSEDTRSQRVSEDPSADFSMSSPFSTLLLAITLCIGASTTLLAQGSPVDENRRGRESNATDRSGKPLPIELLVPFGKDNRPVGDKVYLSQADYDSIAAVVDPDRPMDAQFLSAEYRVALSPPRDSGQLINVEVQADYQIQLAREATRVRLPVRSETLRRTEILSGGGSQIIRTTVDESGAVIATIPPSRQFRLRLTFLPTISAVGIAGTETVAADDERGDEIGEGVVLSTTVTAEAVAETAGVGSQAVETRTTVIRLGIPAIHFAKLVVEAPREIIVLSLGDPKGRSTFRPELGRYEADIGEIRELKISCKPAKRPGQPRSQTFRRAYRITAGIDWTIVECEIEPAEPMSEGDTLQLTILGEPPTSLTSGGWLMLDNQNADSGERATASNANSSGGIYRFVKQTGIDSPIRLLWRLPSVLNDSTSISDSKVMPIPEVFSSGAMRSAPTMFAINSATSIRVSELASGSIGVTEDEFLAAWRGYPGKIQRAFVARDEFPSFRLLQDKYPEPAITVNHQLHVAEDKIELALTATIIDLRPSIRRVLVSVPRRFELVKCLLNGEPVQSMVQVPVLSKTGGFNVELSLGDHRTDGLTTIELVGERPFSGSGMFELPRFEILSDGETRETYRMTRSRSLSVDAHHVAQGDSDGEVSDRRQWEVPELTRQDLLDGQVPVGFAESPGTARVRVKQRSRGAVFACAQKTLMRYSDGRWSCDTLIELPGDRIPDYVDVEIPTRWATDLSVTGGTMWVERQSSDSVVTVIRIALPSISAGNGDSTGDGGKIDSICRVLITANFDNRDQLRVSVPSVHVLGTGKRTQVVAVPDQLTTESIQWRRRAVSALEPDKNWFISFGNDFESSDLYSLYAVVANNWSIELEPLSQATIDPVALSCDARVFLSGDHVLVLQRFDILPETHDEITIALPVGATCIGIWSAGREVDLDHAGSNATSINQNQSSIQKATEIRVPLSYSRLPQPLETLIQVPVVDRSVTEYLTELLGIPTGEVWVTFYQTPYSDQRRRLKLEDPLGKPAFSAPEMMRRDKARAFSLGQSVVTAIDRSRDMLAERSDEEIESWLFPWITRYQSIAASGGHHFLMEVPANSANTRTEEERGWNSLDAQLLQLAGRFLQSNPRLPLPLFSPDRFADYKMISVMRLDSLAELPTLAQTFTPRKSLQSLLVNSITLLTFGLAIILMWPFRGRYRSWIGEPAVWLFVLGFLALFLIPVPVAAMLMIIAVSVPIINRVKTKPASATA